MPARNVSPTDHLADALKLDALRAAVDRWGRVARLAAGEVEAYVANLGRAGESEAWQR
jgi:hypothetical protein